MAVRVVFPNLYYLGWYATGSVATEDHVFVHQQVSQSVYKHFFITNQLFIQKNKNKNKKMLVHNESPLFLLFDTNPGPTAKDLPIILYESFIDVTLSSPRTV